ncbi:MAG: hypothetical protein Q7J34_04335 [Bacteroidales bacterium]|nr:hypothetical protein [Bacteroidales bacterium]
MSPGLQFFYSQTQWLYTILWENPLFFIDYWSFAHFWSGFSMLLIFSALRVKHKWAVLISLLLAYELLEILFLWFALHVFRPETLKDQFTDISIGAAGAFLCYYSHALIKFNRKNKFWKDFVIPALFVSISMAFLWVGFYQYNYNHTFLNFNGLNLTAFGLWASGGFGYLWIQKKLSDKVNNRIQLYVYSYLVYLAGLFVIEFIGYHVLIIKEMSFPDKALVLNMIHGNSVLHTYYLLFPVFINLLFISFRPLFLLAAHHLRMSVSIEETIVVEQYP